MNTCFKKHNKRNQTYILGSYNNALYIFSPKGCVVNLKESIYISNQNINYILVFSQNIRLYWITSYLRCFGVYGWRLSAIIYLSKGLKLFFFNIEKHFCEVPFNNQVCWECFFCKLKALDCRCWAVMPSLTPWAAFVKTDKLLAVSSLFFWLLCDLHAEGKGSGKAVCVHTHLNRLQWWFVINSRLECLLFFKSCSCLSIRLTLKILYFCSADWF